MKKFLVLILFLFTVPICSQTVSQFNNEIDVNNSIEATSIAIDSAWTGSYTDLISKGISSITFFVSADSASAANGFKIYYSIDGSTAVDSVYYSIVSDSTVNLVVTPFTRYYKTSYTNGSKALNRLIIEAILRTQAKGF